MKPSGALRIVCRGLRCRALTPAHWARWVEHESGVPESKCRLGDCRHILSVTRVEPFSGTVGASEALLIIKGKVERQSASALPQTSAPQPSRETTARPILSLTQLTASKAAT